MGQVYEVQGKTGNSQKDPNDQWTWKNSQPHYHSVSYELKKY